jgi:hypothetical protein
MSKVGDERRSPGLTALNRQFDRELAAKTENLGLPDFETRSDCVERQATMLRRFENITLPGSEWRALAGCSAHHCAMGGGCVETCHYGTLHRRVAGLDTGLPLLAAHPGPMFAVTIVHPLWEAPVGRLAQVSIAAAAQWNRRRLAGLKISGLTAIGIFEVSLNRELNGDIYWAGEIQQIVAGATKAELRSAFQIADCYRETRPRQRMIEISGIDNLNRKFAYAQKRLVEERRAYISHATGRQSRRHLPPLDKHWGEFDAWLLGLPLGGRTIVYGCGRRGTTFFAKE